MCNRIRARVEKASGKRALARTGAARGEGKMGDHYSKTTPL